MPSSKETSELDAESLAENGSDIELNTRVKGGETDVSSWVGEGIRVKTEVDFRIEEVRQEIERETRKAYTSRTGNEEAHR